MSGNLTLAEDVSVNYNGHKLTVDNGASSHKVTMGNSVAAEWNGAVAVENDNGALKLTSEGGNTMAKGTLAAESITVESAEGTTMTLQDMALTASGSEITLTNMVVCGDSSFSSTSGTLTLNVAGVTFVLDGDNCTASGLDAILMSADPLTQTQVAPNVFYIDSDMLAGVNVAGNLTLDLSFWADEIAAGGYDNISLSFAEDMLFAEGAEVTAALNGVNYAAAYTAANMVQFSLTSQPTEAIPEPTTATLSLLALTALAARRRRR